MHIPLGTILALVIIIYLVGVVRSKNTDFVTAFSSGWNVIWKIIIVIVLIIVIWVGFIKYKKEKEAEEYLRNLPDYSKPNPNIPNTIEFDKWKIDSTYNHTNIDTTSNR